MSMLLLLTIYGTLFVGTKTLNPVRCVNPGPHAASELKRAAAVYSGQAVARLYIKLDSGGEEVAYRFQVERVWKGDVAREVLLHSRQRRTTDGLISFLDEEFMPELSESYLVYADSTEAGLQAQMCGRSRVLKRAAADLEELGEGKPPHDKEVR